MASVHAFGPVVASVFLAFLVLVKISFRVNSSFTIILTTSVKCVSFQTAFLPGLDVFPLPFRFASHYLSPHLALPERDLFPSTFKLSTSINITVVIFKI